MITRRGFLGTGTAAVASFALPNIGISQDDPPLRMGLVGCGGRGKGAAEDCLKSSKNVQLTALADVFEDRLKAGHKYFSERGAKISEERCFSGFDAYKKILATDIDLVILATPPGFRPIHFAAAVEAGKHVFMEKPVAVDPVGVRKVMEAGRKAKEKKLAVVAGTQRRHEKRYLETMKRIHDGAIGEIVAARCYWNQGELWKVDRKEGMSDMEWQVRNWLYFDWLSGDHIVEQHIHNMDVINWVMRDHPVRAIGVGGRQVRVDPVYGNIFDHFAIDFEYKNGVHSLSMCRQQKGCADNVSEAVVGTKGTSNPAGSIEGETKWRFSGENPNPYELEHADLIASIRRGEPLNEAQQVAESTLTAIMGRQAAYTGKVIKWDELLNSALDFSPPRYEFGDLQMRPVPIPGRNS